MGAVILLSGPSGVGKGTLMSEALARVPLFRMGRSLTTRPYRTGDVMYDYASEEEFHAAFERGELLERNRHMGAWYGKRKPVDDGFWILELDVEGAESAFAQLDNAYKVLITPPEPIRATLEERVRRRETLLPDDKRMTEEQIEDRLDRAMYEIEFSLGHNPYRVIVNDDAITATSELMSLMYMLIDCDKSKTS